MKLKTVLAVELFACEGALKTLSPASTASSAFGELLQMSLHQGVVVHLAGVEVVRPLQVVLLKDRNDLRLNPVNDELRVGVATVVVLELRSIVHGLMLSHGAG